MLTIIQLIYYQCYHIVCLLANNTYQMMLVQYHQCLCRGTWLVFDLVTIVQHMLQDPYNKYTTLLWYVICFKNYV